MRELKLFVDFEFSSLSPDAQPISVGIVSEAFTIKLKDRTPFDELRDSDVYHAKYIGIRIDSGYYETIPSKSFYAEFSDFQLERCDGWVKENVVGKLIYNEAKNTYDKFQYDAVVGNVSMKDSTSEIKGCLKAWLEQFSDYQIVFVVDCGTWDWYHLLQLIGEWEKKECEVRDGDEIYDITSEKGILISSMGDYELIVTTKTGLPILPANISPVPFELNQFIADKKGISVREAFKLNRYELAFRFCGNTDSKVIRGWNELEREYFFYGFLRNKTKNDKHNALFDAKVMKTIYEKLSV